MSAMIEKTNDAASILDTRDLELTGFPFIYRKI